MTDAADYNLNELKVALDPADPRHILPPALPLEARVLDVGCGSGQSLIAAYPDRVTFGVDIDQNALRLGQTLSEMTRLVRSRAEALPFNGGQFDLVFARVSLPYTNIAVSLSEIRRVLKPEGRLWITLHPFAVPWAQVKKSNYKGRVFFLYILANSLLFHLVQKMFRFVGRYESFQTEHGIRRALEQQGFEDIQIVRTQHFLVTASPAGGGKPLASAASAA